MPLPENKIEIRPQTFPVHFAQAGPLARNSWVSPIKVTVSPRATLSVSPAPLPSILHPLLAASYGDDRVMIRPRILPGEIQLAVSASSPLPSVGLSLIAVNRAAPPDKTIPGLSDVPRETLSARNLFRSDVD